MGGKLEKMCVGLRVGAGNIFPSSFPSLHFPVGPGVGKEGTQGL